MKMKHFFLSALMSSSLLSVSAIAADTGTITFNGSVTDTTCKVDIGGSGADGTVNLPPVSTTALNTPGNTVGKTRFTLQLSDCSGAALSTATAKAFFQPGNSVDSATGRLLNQAGGGAATNVSLQLRDGQDDTVINAGAASQTTHTAGFVDISGADIGTASLPYFVEYYAEGSASAGAVTSQVTYNIIYQ
ncbi:fimbrial protein [Entomohabitans teleogrylli]|uniref:fimbrial protein n=1 Tax=Entomohabitans teleogrylli TaxID=1384589 RepID=UPI00073D2FDA|nr:fimbrial protein [Entomohabitans teleogrylli]